MKRLCIPSMGETTQQPHKRPLAAQKTTEQDVVRWLAAPARHLGRSPHPLTAATVRARPRIRLERCFMPRSRPPRYPRTAWGAR
jgi:hypothetical protein